MSDSVSLRAQAAEFAPVDDDPVADGPVADGPVADGPVAVASSAPASVAGVTSRTPTAASQESDGHAIHDGVGAGSDHSSDEVKIILDSGASQASVVDRAQNSGSHDAGLGSVIHPTKRSSGSEIVGRDNQQHTHVNAAVYGGNSFNYGHPNAVVGPIGTQNTHPNYFTNGVTHSAPFMTNATAGSLVPQGQTLLSTGSDPISEGRRIYIGNLKYSVGRYDVKKLLRAFGVYNTVEKIYMPYSDTPLEHQRNDYYDDGRYQPGGFNEPYGFGQGDQDARRPTELPNKGYVFVTYGDAEEAEAAIQRLGGVMHFDRKLVCRPGLPKGVAFRSDEMGNGGHYRQNRHRRRMDELFDENWAGHSYGNSAYGGYGSGALVHGSYGGGAHGKYFGGRGHYQQVDAFGNKGHYANDSGYPMSTFGSGGFYRNNYGGGNYNNYRGGVNSYGGGYRY